MKSKKAMHARHHKERQQMNTRQEGEMKAMMDRHADEMDGAAGPGEEGSAEDAASRSGNAESYSESNSGDTGTEPS